MMNDFDYIEIDPQLVPYQFDIDIEEDAFVFDVRYNDLYDFYTVDLYKNEQLLVAGEKLVYGQPLFAYLSSDVAPAPTIIPLDLAGRENKVNSITLNKTVFLILQNGDGDFE